MEAINKFYLRKSALLKLTDDNLKIEILGGGISDYLLKEYRKAQHGLRDTPDTHPEQLYRAHQGLVSELLRSISSQSSMVRSRMLDVVRLTQPAVLRLFSTCYSIQVISCPARNT